MWLTIRHFLSLAMITLNLYLLLSHILKLTTSRKVTALRLRGKKSYKQIISKPKNKQKKVSLFLLHKASPGREKKETTMNFFNYRKEAVRIFKFLQ